MAASDATPFPIKNQAFRVTFPILDADGDLVTGATGLDSEVSKDAGTFADCTNEATEIATNSGVYYLDLTATEMNADTVAIIVKTSSSGAKTTTIILNPVENGLDIPVDVRYFGGTAATTSGGRPEVNTTHVAGTSQTARDLGATLGVAGAGLTAIPDLAGVTTLLSRLSALRAGYLDNLSAGAVAQASTLATVAGYIDTEVAAIKAVTDLLPDGGALTSLATAAALTAAAADITTLLGRLTSTRAGLLDELDPATAGKMAAEIDVLIARLTSLRAGYLDNLSAGAVATASALAAVAADLPSRITKNTALAGFTFPMFDSADHVTPKTGLTVTAQRSLDGAALASCTNAVTEIGNGLYKIDLAAGDLNGDIVTLRFTATGADATILTLATQPT